MPPLRPSLLRVVPLTTLVLVAFMTSPEAQQRVGVNSAVNPDASGAPPGTPARRLVLGGDVVFNEHITTSTGGQTQILFLDQSGMTVGPNSDLTIDEFVYDPKSSTGKLAMSATQGVLRFIGGKLSKQENGVTLTTPTGSVSVRGGAFLARIGGNCAAARASAQCGALFVFIYGKGLTVTNSAGTQTITRPGFAVTVSGQNTPPSDPGPPPPGATGGLLSQLDGRSGATGGTSTPPTNQTVASSGISTSISGNIAQNVQYATQASGQGQPPGSQSPATNVSGLQQSLAVQNVQGQSDPVILDANLNPTAAGTPIAQPNSTPTPQPSSTPTPQLTSTPSPQPTSAPTPQPNPTPTPQPVTISVAGAFKSTNGPATTAGFVDQSAQGRIPYSGGTITYPANASGTLQNGTFAAPIGGQQTTISPLTPGSTNPVTAQTNLGAATGTATMTADGNFFYANLTPTGTNQRQFVSGGVPVNQAFYAPTPNPQFLSFRVQPDAALASSTGQQQTIPFLPSNYGGTMPNATASQMYVVTGPNSQFGAFNAISNPNPSIVSPEWLQASLAVNGQGANQTSALVVGNGNFHTSSDSGQVVAGGVIRGTVSQSATAPVVGIFSGAQSVPDANGNSLYGGNTLSGFVLDQNTGTLDNHFAPQLATAAQFGQANGSYAYNQPVTTTGTFAPGQRAALNETGFFGGVMAHTTNPNPTVGSPYVLTGGTNVQADPVSNRVAATFAGGDPFTSRQSGVNSMTLQFGSLPASGRNYSRSVYVDNNNYAALESPLTPSQINGQNLPTLTTAANPNTNAPGSAPPGSGQPNLTPSLAMVTSGTVPNNWMPTGVTPCACQFLQWGYWTGEALTPNANLTAATRNDRAYINTWVAGMPTVTMPTTGVGTYNGAAVGTVFNNGATYMAAGGFNQSYNFGSQTGTVNITNFDNANYSASVAGSGNTFGGSFNGPPNRSGTVIGRFYGPGAVETGGAFNILNTSGPKYVASGIFAGK